MQGQAAAGTAGWSIPRDLAEHFPAAGSALERYASKFAVAEINSSFHRAHRMSTWERWRDSVPEGFRFAVKLPKSITHTRKLLDCQGELSEFLEQAHTLKSKLAVLLVQLPPKLAFDTVVTDAFFSLLTGQASASIVCEPRHSSWFGEEASELLAQLDIARAAADPAICEAAARPGHWGRLSYWRLHGSPVMYRSSYANRLEQYAAALNAEVAAGRDVWCIFDNTASSAAAADALALRALI